MNTYAAVATSTPKPRTSAAPTVHHTGLTTHAGAVHDENLEEELLGDFLFFSQERERVEQAEERRWEEERKLAQRVKRQATTEGSGVNDGKLPRCRRRCCCFCSSFGSLGCLVVVFFVVVHVFLLLLFLSR